MLEKLYELQLYLEDIESLDEKTIDEFVFKINELEKIAYLSSENDFDNAILEIHSGAGGTEACDWAEMLNKMYINFLNSKQFTVKLIDKQDGEEAGLRRIVYLVEGKYAYGNLKSEKGVHRLVRISPFDSGKRRHTSFAAVEIIPYEENKKVEIKVTDLKIDVYRSSGAGGQGVNTTDSAVRITHLPTNIVVTCQNERSQHKNKELALKVLKSKLLQRATEEKKERIEDLKSINTSINFGAQIRSYILNPYSLVKDHRTNYETSNVQKVLDGEIDDFIQDYLRKDQNEKN